MPPPLPPPLPPRSQLPSHHGDDGRLIGEHSAKLENNCGRIVALEGKVAALDTRQDATEQRIALMEQSRSSALEIFQRYLWPILLLLAGVLVTKFFGGK